MNGLTKPSGWTEDNTVSPNCVQGQICDLEGFYLSGNKLTVVGGFDFKNGQQDPYRPLHYYSGDVFLGRSVLYGASAPHLSGIDGYRTLSNNYGYEYVLRMDFNNNTFNVYALTSNTLLDSVYFRQNVGAGPLTVNSVSGLTNVASGTLIYTPGLADSTIDGYTVWGTNHNHYSVELDFNNLNFLLPGTDYFLHTYGCGNDDSWESLRRLSLNPQRFSFLALVFWELEF
jgi:hypothetical protein